MSVWIPDLFIRELVTIDACTSSSVSICDVTALAYKSFHNSMEEVVLIMQPDALLTGTKASDIFSSFWNLGGEQLEYDSSSFECLIVLM